MFFFVKAAENSWTISPGMFKFRRGGGGKDDRNSKDQLVSKTEVVEIRNLILCQQGVQVVWATWKVEREQVFTNCLSLC